MDKEKIKQLTRELIIAIGEDPDREGVLETPHRVAEACEKIYGGYSANPREFVTEFEGEDYDEMIICKNIDFFSTCEHHMMPFFGKVHIGYLPTKKIIGVSKLPRIVEMFARRMQNQERLTMQIARSISDLLNPQGVGVVMEAQHLCMMCRGVEKQNAIMTTSSFTKAFRASDKTRSEFLRLIR
ncbi:MAG: GTP cyclohydrolase I FolE [Deltaproteobacteria bacterium]|nr:GTP cyclohydrolase I FolE [Deltaproteobacteria bacterium]